MSIKIFPSRYRDKFPPCDGEGQGRGRESPGLPPSVRQRGERPALRFHARPGYNSASDSNAERATWILGSPKRSEEHTSELQSLMRISYAVFCLKTKKHKKTTQTSVTKENGT